MNWSVGNYLLHVLQMDMAVELGVKLIHRSVHQESHPAPVALPFYNSGMKGTLVRGNKWF